MFRVFMVYYFVTFQSELEQLEREKVELEAVKVEMEGMYMNYIG